MVGDKDWFSINTVENDELKISLIGNSLKDSYLNIYDSNGIIVHSNDDYSDLSLDSEITFSATIQVIIIFQLRHLKIVIKEPIH